MIHGKCIYKYGSWRKHNNHISSNLFNDRIKFIVAEIMVDEMVFSIIFKHWQSVKKINLIFGEF